MHEVKNATSSSLTSSPHWSLASARRPGSLLDYIRNQGVVIFIFLYQFLALLSFALTPILAINGFKAPATQLANQSVYLYIPYLTGLVYMGTSLWVFSIRRSQSAGQAFALFTTSVAIAASTLFDVFTSQRLTFLWTFAICMAGGALFNLGWLFPQESRLVKRYPLVKWGGYFPAAGLVAHIYNRTRTFTTPETYFLAHRPAIFYLGFAVLLFLGWTIFRRLRSSSPVVREQSILILWGSVFALGPVLGFFAAKAIEPGMNFTPLVLLPLSAFPLLTAYAMLRYRLVSTDYILSRAVLYALLSVLAASAYVFLVAGMSLIFGNTIPANNPIVIGLLVLMLALGLNPLRAFLQNAIDKVFFKGQVVHSDRLQVFAHELTQTLNLDEVVILLHRYVSQTLLPGQFHIFVHNPLGDHYAATRDEQGTATSDVRFEADSALPRFLSQRKASLFLKEGDSLPPAVYIERNRLAILDANLFIPLPGQKRLVGWMALGNRLSGEPYTASDVSYLESLADHAALVIERVQVVADLERRVHEMNVLTRLAEGINVTLAFNDLLELFYAQTDRLIPMRDFRITLLDDSREHLYHAFYLEDDERLTAFENQLIPEKVGLESEVVARQQSLATADYEQECRSRGLIPGVQGVYAWIGVPLNAGADTIGAVSMASRDPSEIYTREQADLLQAIAGLAAGAIVKARLLEETELSERQMRTLNEIARSISSTLDLDLLLQEIMRNAVDILACEAGSLLMVDQNTGEAVFEVAVGPVGDELIGQRVPAGAGLVGKAVTTGEAIIQNDVRRSSDWFDTDKETGYSTQDLLVVPMKVKDRVIGVLEVLNKKDRSAFTQKDRDLLGTFAAQAVVAIENARLYTLTDQALAARVDELSVMQHIDRELNASLEVNRAMRITLEWSLRQSRAEAGLVGEVTADGIRVLVTQGYDEELDDYPDSVLPLSLPTFQAPLRDGQSVSIRIRKGEDFQLLSGAKAQIIVPIRRESKTIGVLFLESGSAEDCPTDVLAFLSRLSDHAAIAISNAQLYAAVQSASLAKSQFVSAAAHELKNPLTSIKGYADLLVAGAVGSVSEPQANFLATIRSNAERMATLVSDLQDLSRIEAGQLRLQFSKVDLSEAIEEVKRSLHRQIEEKGQQFEVNVAANLPPLWVDHTRLAQILTNLASNAHKYTPPGGTIMIRAGKIASPNDVSVESQLVHVAVEDTGIGIAPEDQRKIFQQFFRSEDPKVREVTGTGLSTFHFTVPVSEDE
jgi:signal transduction histidine kinase